MRIWCLVVVAVVAAACSSAGTAQPALEPTPTAIAVAEPTATPEPTKEPTTAPEPEPTEDPTPEPTDVEAVQAAWENFAEGALGPAGNEDDLALALQYGTDKARLQLAVVQGSADRVVDQHYTKIEPTDTGWIINDCFSTSPPFGNPAWLWISAVVNDTDTGPFVESVAHAGGTINCVPAEISTEVIAGWEAFLDAEVVIFAPPDPDHPLVTATATGLSLESQLRDLRQAKEDGWELRGRPDSHPYVSDFRSSGEWILTDCQEIPSDRGAYLTANGERLDDLIPPVVEGQRDRLSVLMRLEDGAWKVAEGRLNVNVDCDLEPGADAFHVV